MVVKHGDISPMAKSVKQITEKKTNPTNYLDYLAKVVIVTN